jgi:hypothetical protein
MEAVAGTSFKTVISQKKFKELPIFIAENHNEVFSHFYFNQILVLYKHLFKISVCYYVHVSLILYGVTTWLK